MRTLSHKFQFFQVYFLVFASQLLKQFAVSAVNTALCQNVFSSCIQQIKPLKTQSHLDEGTQITQSSYLWRLSACSVSQQCSVESQALPLKQRVISSTQELEASKSIVFLAHVPKRHSFGSQNNINEWLPVVVLHLSAFKKYLCGFKHYHLYHSYHYCMQLPLSASSETGYLYNAIFYRSSLPFVPSYPSFAH